MGLGFVGLSWKWYGGNKNTAMVSDIALPLAMATAFAMAVAKHIFNAIYIAKCIEIQYYCPSIDEEYKV